VAGSAVAFWVDGLPYGQSLSPWLGFTKAFGRNVRVRLGGGSA